MKSALPLLSLLIALAVVALFVLKRRGMAGGGGNDPWPFFVKRPLTTPEQVLYHRLLKALPEHVVLAQVQVSRVLGVKKGFNFHQWNNRINRLSYDFIVCGKDASVIAAVELDDKSHEATDRSETDAKKAKATADAGLRLLRWHVKALPDEATIRAQLLNSVPAVPASSDRPPKAPDRPAQRLN
jgi:very-short-patch-repair endonuclease